MTMPKTTNTDIELLRTWSLSSAATLGSSARAKGILQEIQARLPTAVKKAVSLDGRDVVLALPANDKAVFAASVAVINKVMDEAETLPVISREIQDILTIKSTERHRWLADGRLPSAGTRTVRLNGRARQITFHVFDLKVVEDLLNQGTVDEWRERDTEAKAEKKREAAYRANLTRSLKKAKKARKMSTTVPGASAISLRGWDDFNHLGLLK